MYTANFLHFLSSVDPEGGRGLDHLTPPPPPEKSQKYIGFTAVLVRISWKITKLPSQYSMRDHHRPASGNGPTSSVFGSSLPVLTKRKKNVFRFELDPTDKTFWIVARVSIAFSASEEFYRACASAQSRQSNREVDYDISLDILRPELCAKAIVLASKCFLSKPTH